MLGRVTLYLYINPMKIIVIALLLLTLAIIGIWYINNTGYGYLKHRHRYELHSMMTGLKNVNFSEVVSVDSEPGRLNQIPSSIDLDMFLSDQMAYIVRLDPPTMTLTLNGRLRPEVFGLIGNGGFDGKIDYLDSEAMVVPYHPTNGTGSSGDIYVLYNDSGQMIESATQPDTWGLLLHN